MTYQKRIVLNCPSGYLPALDMLVEDFLRAGVDLVAVSGKDYAKIEDVIDELIVGDGSDPGRFFNTTSHASLEDAVEFAGYWPTDSHGAVQVVEL